MNTLAHAKANISEKPQSNNTIDTTFVLFFLAIEFGRSLALSLDNFFMGAALLSVMILPFWLNTERGKFSEWILGRGAIAALAILLGIAFRQSIGIFIPESFRFLPMSMLMLTAFLSCYFQFYGFFKVRFVK